MVELFRPGPGFMHLNPWFAMKGMGFPRQPVGLLSYARRVIPNWFATGLDMVGLLRHGRVFESKVCAFPPRNGVYKEMDGIQTCGSCTGYPRTHFGFPPISSSLRKMVGFRCGWFPDRIFLARKAPLPLKKETETELNYLCLAFGDLNVSPDFKHGMAV